MHMRPAFAAVLVLTGACMAKGAKYPDLNSFCNARASAECNMAVVLACAIASSATCVNKRQAICVNNVPAGTTYNAAAAEDCVTQVTNAYADAKITLDESKAINAACNPVFEGPGATGAACQADSNCRTSAGLRCVLSPGSGQGTCQVPQVILGGFSCSAPSAQCVTGFHCGPTAHCDSDALVNETCGSGNPCGPDLQCSSAMAVCQPKGADGTACTSASGDECLHGICNKPMMTSATGLCVSEITLASMEPFCVDSR